MNIKKALAIMGSVLILGAGLGLAADSPQKVNRNIFPNKAKSKSPAGLYFLDENGDGICDFAHQLGNRNGLRSRNATVSEMVSVMVLVRRLKDQEEVKAKADQSGEEAQLFSLHLRRRA